MRDIMYFLAHLSIVLFLGASAMLLVALAVNCIKSFGG